MLFRRVLQPYLTWFTLFRASWHSASTYIIAQSLGMVLVLIASRGLGAEPFGKIGAIGAYFGWFGLIIGYSVSAKLPSLLAERRHQPHKQAEACATVLALTLLFTVAGMALALLLLPLGLQRLNLTEFSGVALLFAAFFALMQIRGALDSISQYFGWLPRWSVSNLAATLLPILLLGGLLIANGHFTPLQYMTFYVLASIAATAFTFWLFLQAIGGWSELHVDRTIIRPLLLAGGGPWLSLLSGTAVSYGVPLIIAHFLLGKENIAYYNIVLSLNNWVTLAGMAVSMPAMARWSKLAAEGRLPELRRELRRNQLASGLVITTFMLLVGLFAAPLVHLLYGPGYDAVIPLFRLCVILTSVTGFGGWYWLSLFSLGHPSGVGPPNFCYAIPIVVISYLTMRFTHLGMCGVIMAMDIGIVLWLICYEILFRRAYRIESAKRADVVQTA